MPSGRGQSKRSLHRSTAGIIDGRVFDGQLVDGRSHAAGQAPAGASAAAARMEPATSPCRRREAPAETLELAMSARGRLFVSRQTPFDLTARSDRGRGHPRWTFCWTFFVSPLALFASAHGPAARPASLPRPFSLRAGWRGSLK